MARRDGCGRGQMCFGAFCDESPGIEFSLFVVFFALVYDTHPQISLYFR